MTTPLELLVPEFGEVPDDEWGEAEKSAIEEYSRRLQTYPGGPVDAKVETRNIGRGADWVVVAISISSTLAVGFFAIPKAHKYVRESIEEWRRIFEELKAVFRWLRIKRAFYPDGYLFLLALDHIGANENIDVLVYQGMARLPESNPDLHGQEPLLFTFTSGRILNQVAVSREAKIMWHNKSELYHVEI